MQDNQKNTFSDYVYDDNEEEEDERRGLMYPQINSFNYFVMEKLYNIVERLVVCFGGTSSSQEKKKTKHQPRFLKIKNVEIQKYPTHPPMEDAHLFPKADPLAKTGLKKLYPGEVRSISGSTYDSPVYVDLVEVDENDEVVDVILKRHLFFRLPIMVGSVFSNNEKEEDYGGYFIINGTERMIIPQETFAINKIIKYTSDEVEIHCKSNNLKYPIPIITRFCKKDNVIYWKASSKLQESIPIPILMCALLPHGNQIDPFEVFGKMFSDDGDFFMQSIY